MLYVICDYVVNEDEIDFISNNFGKVISIHKDVYHILYFYNGVKRYYCFLTDITHHSKSLESIELLLHSGKFNI